MISTSLCRLTNKSFNNNPDFNLWTSCSNRQTFCIFLATYISWLVCGYLPLASIRGQLQKKKLHYILSSVEEEGGRGTPLLWIWTSTCSLPSLSLAQVSEHGTICFLHQGLQGVQGLYNTLEGTEYWLQFSSVLRHNPIISSWIYGRWKGARPIFPLCAACQVQSQCRAGVGEEEDIMVREGKEGARGEGAQGEGLWQGKKKPDPWSCLHPNLLSSFIYFSQWEEGIFEDDR